MRPSGWGACLVIGDAWFKTCSGHWLIVTVQGPVSRKSRNFTGHFRVTQFPLYLKNGEDLSRQTSQSFFFYLPWKHVKRSAFQNKRLAVSQIAFRARKVFGTFEKRAPGAPNKPFFQNKPKISRSEGYIDCKKNQWPSEQKYFSKKMWEHEHTEKKLPAQQKSFSQQLPITSFSSQHIKHTCGTPPLGAPDSCYSWMFSPDCVSLAMGEWGQLSMYCIVFAKIIWKEEML